jgi:arylsulfatase A-like enzyme
MNRQREKRTVDNWSRFAPLLLAVAGILIVATAFAADAVHIGTQEGFGADQRLLASVGFAVLMMGTFLALPVGKRTLQAVRAAARARGEESLSSAVRLQPATYLLLAMWFGLVIGLGEAAAMVLKTFCLHTDLWFNPDLIWMAPLADVCILTIPGLILAFVAWRWPEFVSLRIATLVLAFAGFRSVLLLFPRLHILAAVLLSAGLAVQTARVIAEHPSAFHRLVRYTMRWPQMLPKLGKIHGAQSKGKSTSADTLLSRREFLVGSGATIAALAAGVHGWEKLLEQRTLSSLPPSRPNAPNVLLVVLDTVRAQSCSLYGYNRPTTPQLERLANGGVCFERAISTSPWTLPSHASMFTSRFPHELSADREMPLDDTYRTLAEALSDHGYVTAGFVANVVYCNRGYGLQRGFAHYEDYPVSLGQTVLSSSLGRTMAINDRLRNMLGYHETLNRKTAAAVNAAFLRWLSRQDSRPFFAFLNYFDAHEPYLPPPPFDVMFGPRRPRGDFWHMPDFAGHCDKWLMSPEEIQVELDAYEGAIASIDHQLGLLFDELDRLGALQNTLVIITSDHGEEFGEHGVFDHGHSLYLPSLHVPLLILFPSRVPAGWRVREPASLRDLPATVVDLLELGGGSHFAGETLARHWQEANRTGSPAANGLLSEVNRGSAARQEWYPIAKGDMKSLLDERYHYVHNGDGSEELYDFPNDPWEQRDLARSPECRPVLERFKESLDAMLV